MFNKSKGCLNESCNSYLKKIKYKDSEDICPECGTKLVKVCNKKGCYKPTNEGEKYCLRHKQVKSDSMNKAKKVVGSAVTLAIIGVVKWYDDNKKG